MISNYERMYMAMALNIMYNGEQIQNQRTGIVTRRLPNQLVTVDMCDEFPILKSKKCNWKSAIQEMLWIYQKQSNNTKDLGNHIWDHWSDEDGSIGKAYGYQIAKEVKIKQGDEISVFDNQMDYVLKTLAEDPSDRRCVIDLWDVQDLSEMNLTPCVYTSSWNLDGGRLNCSILQRSADVLLGVVFNMMQFAAMNLMMSAHLHVNPGIVTFLMADCHIYEDQIEIFESKQLENYNAMLTAENSGETEDTDLVDILNSEPRVVVPTDKTFWEMTEEDIKLEDYKSYDKIEYPIAI